jgi:hypothetical protein
MKRPRLERPNCATEFVDFTTPQPAWNMAACKQAEDVLIAALAGGASPEVAAGRCGVAEPAVRRWLADPRFRRRVVLARAELTERTAGLLTATGVRRRRRRSSTWG